MLTPQPGGHDIPSAINSPHRPAGARSLIRTLSGIAIVNDTVYMAAMRGQRLWRIELSGTSAGAASTYFVSTYGRLRAVEKIPEVNAIWFGTTNSDARGSGAADVIRRSNIQ